MEELTYLKTLNQKYPRRLKQYFGFSLKEIALFIGINYTLFIRCINGQRRLPAKHQAALQAAFERFKVVDKTKDFKESPTQLWWREWRKKILLDKQRISVIVLFTMAHLTTFYFPAKVNFCLYIKQRRGNNLCASLRIKSRPIVNCLKQSMVGLFLRFYTAIFTTIRSIFLSLRVHYEPNF